MSFGDCCRDAMMGCSRFSRERLSTLCLFSSIVAFLVTFLTFDFFSTLLGLVVLVLVAISTCDHRNSVGPHHYQHSSYSNSMVQASNATTYMTACLLSYVASGVAWWTVLAIVLTDICEEMENANLHNNNNGANEEPTIIHAADANTESPLFTNAINATMAPSTRAPGSSSGIEGNSHIDRNNEYNNNTGEMNESVQFFCDHKHWILGFTVMSASLWMLVGFLLMILVVTTPSPPPPTPIAAFQRNGRYHADDNDGDTVAETVVGDEEWVHHGDALAGEVSEADRDATCDPESRERPVTTTPAPNTGAATINTTATTTMRTIPATTE